MSLSTSLKKIDQKLLDGRWFGQLATNLNKNKSFLLFLVIVGIIGFAYELTAFSVSLDEEFHARELGPKLNWIQQDRWFQFVLNALLVPDAVMPFWPSFIAVFFTALSFYVITQILSDEISAADYIAAPLAIISPILYYSFCFRTLGYGIGTGFFISALALMAYFKCPGNISRLLTVILLTCAIGIYQAMIFYQATVLLFILLNSLILGKITNKQGLVSLGVYSILAVIALALSTMVSALLKSYLELPSDPYLNSLVRYELSPDYLSKWFGFLPKIFSRYYGGDPNYYVYELWAIKGLVVLALAGVIQRIFSSKAALPEKCLSMVVLGALFFVPIVISFINMDLPPRTYIAVPIFISLLAYVAFKGSINTVKIIIGLLAVYIAIRFVIANNRLALADDLSWRSDRELSVQLISRINELDQLKPTSQKIKLEIVGSQNWEESPLFVKRHTVGSSFFYQNGGSSWRVINLFYTMGETRFQPTPPMISANLVSFTKDMPAWPAKDSIRYNNGVVIIKFGDYTPLQKQAICHQKQIVEFCDSKN